MPVTPTNPAKRIAGPCLIRNKGIVYFSKGDVVLDPIITPFDVESSAADPDAREDTFTWQVKFTPVGYVSAEILAAFYYTGNILTSRLVHHKRAFLPAAVVTATNIITITAHGFRDGHAVCVTSDDTLPAGSTENAIVFLHKLSANTFTLHPTEADALANTNALDLTTQGTGTHYIIESEYLEIHSLTDDDEKYHFYNTAIIGIPTLTIKPNVTPFGEITYECYRKFGVAHSADNAFYTRSLEVNAEAGDLDYDQVITEAGSLTWGAAKPFDAFTTKDGAAISFGLTLDAVLDGAGGIASRKIMSQEVTLTAEPNYITAEAVWAKRKVQGAGTGTGRRLAAGADPLNLISDSIYARLYGAICTTSPAQYSKTLDRLGALTWKATRTYNAGVANPLYSVSEEAPV
ncbi:MAG TPA: hypothetical protein VK985_09585 [Rariglobus sp.]|nr:hypothetical protein [Rariglobus sp.]